MEVSKNPSPRQHGMEVRKKAESASYLQGGALRMSVGDLHTEHFAPPSMQLVFLATGLAAGLLSGLFGIGGGIVIVPALLFFTKMEPSTATGTSLGALLLPVGALG